MERWGEKKAGIDEGRQGGEKEESEAEEQLRGEHPRTGRRRTEVRGWDEG